jgi:hypothetical protein
VKAKVKQFIDKNKVTNGITPLLDKPIRIRKVKDAKRLLSKLIYEMQIGKIQSQQAKDLTYLLISFVNITTATEFELRLNLLEEQAKK